jgi:hypothetical protein
VFIENTDKTETFNIFPEIRYYKNTNAADNSEHIMLDIYFTDNFETMYNGATVYVKA